MTQSELHVAVSSTQVAQATVLHLLVALQPVLNAQVTDAFMQGLHRGCLVAAGAALVVAVAALTHLPKVQNEASSAAVVHA